MRLAISILLAACIAALSACRGEDSTALSADEAAKLLENRNWIDHWPKSETEKLFVYRFTPQMGGGVFQDRTLFKGVFELFVYEVKADELRIRWPHTRTRDAIKFRIEPIKGHRPFDLRLVLEGTSRGPTVYYGQRNESHAAPLIPELP